MELAFCPSGIPKVKRKKKKKENPKKTPEITQKKKKKHSDTVHGKRRKKTTKKILCTCLRLKKKRVPSQKKQKSSISNPSCSSMRQRALMIAQCLSRREEASTFFAREFADLAMLGNFMAETIVLSRKLFCTAKGAGE